MCGSVQDGEKIRVVVKVERCILRYGYMFIDINKIDFWNMQMLFLDEK